MEFDNKTALFRLGERVFIGNADGLRAKMEPIFMDENVKKIILDLECVEECDSYGLKLFIDFQRRADSAEKELIFYRPNTSLKELFNITKLDEVFIITEAL